MPSRLSEHPHCDFLSSPDGWHGADVHAAWEQLLARSDPLGAVYRSPAWFDHMSASDPRSQFRLAVLRNENGEVDGIAPLAIRRVPIELHVAGRTMTPARVRVVDLIGGQPLVADDPPAYERLLDALSDMFPQSQGIRLADIPSEGPLFRHLRQSPAVHERFMVCVLDGLAPYQTLPLPETFDDYLSRFSRKKRYNLKRQERLLRDAGNGQLELRRWDMPEGVPSLMKQLTELSERSAHEGDHWQEVAGSRFVDLAARKLLRCYTLLCGGEPVAAMVGYQYGTTYTVDTTLYDRTLARLSPGTTMTHLVVADLLEHCPARLIDFGYGKPSHDQQPPRVPRTYAKVFLLRRKLSNRVLWAGVCALRASARLLGGRFRRLSGRK